MFPDHTQILLTSILISVSKPLNVSTRSLTCNRNNVENNISPCLTNPISNYKPIPKIPVHSNTRFCHIINLLNCKIYFTINIWVDNLIHQHISIHHIKCSLKINTDGIYIFTYSQFLTTLFKLQYNTSLPSVDMLS